MVSVLALAPTLTSATQPVQVGTLEFGTMAINATGQATPLNEGKGSPSPATLSLNGTAYEQGFGGLRLDHLHGLLSIGSTNYTILDGQGEVNKNGDTQINAQVNGGKHWNSNELDLHGSIQGTSASFNSPESKLSSLYFLSLKGQASLTLKTVTFSLKNPHNEESETSTSRKNHHGEEENETTTVTLTVNNTEYSNRTIIQTQTQTVANTTITQLVNVTTTVANTTITTTVSK
jgi:hypothetical protein